jgi:hypothetical protein
MNRLARSSEKIFNNIMSLQASPAVHINSGEYERPGPGTHARALTYRAKCLSLVPGGASVYYHLLPKIHSFPIWLAATPTRA